MHPSRIGIWIHALDAPQQQAMQYVSHDKDFTVFLFALEPHAQSFGFTHKRQRSG